jgi:hypothetical protein
MLPPYRIVSLFLFAWCASCRQSKTCGRSSSPHAWAPESAIAARRYALTSPCYASF